MLNKLTNKHPQLPAILLLVLVFLLLGLAFRARSSVFPATPTLVARVATVTLPVAPSLTASTTPTFTLTPRPTWTLAPTSTPTPTETALNTPAATLLPTITPARPLQFNDLYQLREWTPERAATLVQMMQGYPDARFPRPSDHTLPAYSAAYRYAAYALKEALLRFPDEPQSDGWRWDLAYSLARLNDPGAGNQYLTLIEEALNGERVTPHTLPGWFEENEPRLELAIIDLTPLEHVNSSQVIEIKTTGGGVYLWMLESRQSYRGVVLLSHFDFSAQITPEAAVGDLTGDGFEELVVAFSPEAGSFLLQQPHVFDLSEVPAKALEFVPELPFDFAAEFENKWIIAESGDGNPYLQFIGSIYPACPVRVTRSYDWNGSQFAFNETRYNIQPYPELLGHCESIVTHIANTWEPGITARLARSLLPEWPPVARPDGRPYPEDALDEWRLKTGIYSTLAGEEQEGIQILQDLSTSPTVPESRWAEQAKRFLESYQTPDDLYIACREIEDCDMQLALERLARAIPSEDYHNAPAYLHRFGVEMRGSGSFDFENDGQPERWLLVRQRPGQKLELWIMAQGPDSARALFVEEAESDDLGLRFHEPVSDPPVVQTRMRAGFILQRVPTTREPYLVHVPVEFFPTTYTRDALEGATQALLSGVDPSVVRRNLMEVRESSRYNCLNYRICDQYLYTLGLAHELSGETGDAIDTYIDLWWNERASPFTTMARLKLEQLPYNTPTPTRTPTWDPNASPTPTRTATASPTPDPNATPTLSPTP